MENCSQTPNGKTNSMKSCIKLQDAAPQNWTFGPPQRNAHNATIVPIMDCGVAPRIQLANNMERENALSAPFGISSFSDSGDATRKNLNLSFSNPAITLLFSELSTQVKNYVWGKRHELIRNPPINREFCGAMFKSPVRQGKEGMNDILQTKINMSGTKGEVKVWIVHERGFVEGSTKDIISGSEVIPVVSIAKIWFMTNQFGISMDTVALIVWERKKLTFEDVFHT